MSASVFALPTRAGGPAALPGLPLRASSPGAPPWLSILIPVFNVAPYLTECIDSVEAQLLAGVEVLALDDASTDGSAEVLQRLAATRPWLRALSHARNAGLSVARNTLLQHASGEYLWFLDSDDRLAPGAIRGLHALLQRQSIDLVLCDFQHLTSDPATGAAVLQPRRRATFRGSGAGPVTSTSRLLEGLFRARRLHAWSKIAHRDLWTSPTPLEFPPGRLFEDIASTVQLALRARRAWYEPASWVHYRQREGSVVSQTTERTVTDFAEAMMPLRPLLEAPGLDRRAREAWMRFAVRNFVGASHMTRRLVRQGAHAASSAGPSTTPERGRWLRRQHLAALEASLPIASRHFMHQLWLRGHWIEAWRLFRCRHEAR